MFNLFDWLVGFVEFIKFIKFVFKKFYESDSLLLASVEWNKMQNTDAKYWREDFKKKVVTLLWIVMFLQINILFKFLWQFLKI